MNTVETDVLIVGAGPSGLAAAIELRRLGVAHVLVVDRETQAGGIPRYSNHIGFGLRDMRRVMFGPRYAARYVQQAERAGVEIMTGVTATGWKGTTRLNTTGPNGLGEINARAVVVATGCRERPRAARLIPGSRPQGILTTGSLQQFVHLHRQPVGRRAVVIGAEHVSFSAVLTLVEGGASVAAMVTDLPHHQSYALYKLLSADRFRVPIYTNMRLSRIIGRRRVEAVELTHVGDGHVTQIACDTVVFTGDWIPDHELARLGGLAIDPGTKGPRVDLNLRTSARGVFAAGNLLHGAETADVAALSGRYVARSVGDYLERGAWPEADSVPIEYDDPILWVSPNVIGPGQVNAPHGHFILRVKRFLTRSTLEVRQGDCCLSRRPYRRMVPNLPVHASDRWLHQVDPTAGAVRFVLI